MIWLKVSALAARLSEANKVDRGVYERSKAALAGFEANTTSRLSVSGLRLEPLGLCLKTDLSVTVTVLSEKFPGVAKPDIYATVSDIGRSSDRFLLVDPNENLFIRGQSSGAIIDVVYKSGNVVSTSCDKPVPAQAAGSTVRSPVEDVA